MNILALRKDLELLARYRAKTGRAMGDASGWANVLARVARAFYGELSVELVRQESKRVGLDHWFGRDALPRALIDIIVKEVAGRPWVVTTDVTEACSAAEVGVRLGLTWAEREAAGIIRIDAIDEPAAERKRRLARERQRRKRERMSRAFPLGHGSRDNNPGGSGPRTPGLRLVGGHDNGGSNAD